MGWGILTAKVTDIDENIREEKIIRIRKEMFGCIQANMVLLFLTV